jgi:hypothetical protein
MKIKWKSVALFIACAAVALYLTIMVCPYPEVAKIIPYDRFLQKRIDKSAKRIHDQLIQQQRDRIDDLIGRLRSVVDKPKEE